jgi:hypothetical protein
VSVPSSTGGEVCMGTGGFEPVFMGERGVGGRVSRANQGGGGGGGSGSQVGV